jgi:hypothetical protein
VKFANAVFSFSLLSALLGCDRPQASVTAAAEVAPAMEPPKATADNDTFVIDYAHESAGVFHHGTLSLIGGKVAVTWTLDQDGKKKSHDMAMTVDTFRGVWDAFNDVPDFEAGEIQGRNQKLDPSTHHVVKIVFKLDGENGTRTYMVPASKASPAFKAWLTKIGYGGK